MCRIEGAWVALGHSKRGLDGVLGWLAAFKGALVPEIEADDYLARAAARDPDIWVIEIEDRSGHNPFEGDIF